jgi:HSP20 family protein
MTQEKQRTSRALQTSEPQTLSLIDRFFGDTDPFGLLTPSLFGHARLGQHGALFPKVDVSENENEIRVIANVPGMKPEDIDIEVGDDYLSLAGTIEKSTEDNGEKMYRYEREYGAFRREFALPARVQKDAIVAKVKDGVLTLTLPKSEAERRTKVRVETE